MKKIVFFTAFIMLATNMYSQTNPKAIDILTLYNNLPLNERPTLDPFEEKIKDTIISNSTANNPMTQRSGLSNTNFEDGGPENMIDKSTLKPTAGSFSSDITAISDNLNQGKVSVNIPLFDFEYYDYKIPVFINNNYPQTMVQTKGSPIFYINSKIGGDWNLSIDQYKVSRQINGNEDENPSKGYFSSFSQSRVNNISAINNGDVINGLKGSWDPAIDVFSFSTPTISGSFLLNLIDGSFKNLTGGNFTVKYTRNSSSLLSFTITDEQGNQYLFGGTDNSIEQTQSKTGVQSRGVDYNGTRFKYIVELQSIEIPGPHYSRTEYKVISFSELPDYSNYYDRVGYLPLYPLSRFSWTNQTINDFLNNRHLGQALPQVGSLHPLGGNIYGIPSPQLNRISNLPGATTDDPDLRQTKVNTAWYLKEIKLINGKKIFFNYVNSWKAYPTYGANKTELTLKTGTFNYSGYNNVVTPITVRYYPCMPEGFGPLQFPINESYSETINFVKSPELTQIFDEDFSSQIDIPTNYTTAQPRPFVGSPSIYANVPNEVLDGGHPQPVLTNKITYIKNHQYFDVEFKNSTLWNTFVQDGTTYRIPKGDVSYLNEVIINGDKKYLFTYDGRNLSTIKYPTGAKKQFYASARTQGLQNFTEYGNFYLHNERVVDSIVTTAGKNKTVEKYVYSDPEFYTNWKSTTKTFRPSIATCTDFASFTSTTPIVSNFAVKNGLYFANAKKYINKELRISSDIDQPYGDANTLYLTDGTSPSYTNQIGRPATKYDQRYGLNTKTIQYKKNTANQPVKQQTSDIKYEFTTPTFELPSVYLTNIEAGPWSNTSGAIRRGYSRYYFPVGDEVNKTVVTDSIFMDDDTSIKTESTSIFSRFTHSLGTNAKKLTKSTNIDSEGNSWTTEFLNVNSSARNLKLTDSPLFQSMRKNNISPDLFKIEYKNTDIINIEAYKYKLLNINNNIPVLESQKKIETTDTNLNSIVPFTFNASDPNNFIYDAKFKDKIIYDQYDNNGRLIEYHPADGVHTVIIWGYNSQYPIAKIENATYSEVQPYVSNLQSLSKVDYDNCTAATCKEQILRNALNELRNIPNLSNKWQVSTFTYDYNIGITSSTDGRGNTSYYEYDGFNRLKSAKDAQGKILSNYQYNYKQ